MALLVMTVPVCPADGAVKLPLFARALTKVVPLDCVVHHDPKRSSRAEVAHREGVSERVALADTGLVHPQADQ